MNILYPKRWLNFPCILEKKHSCCLFLIFFRIFAQEKSHEE